MIRFDDIQPTANQVERTRFLLSLLSDQRYDANETVHFARALEYVKARTYDISYGKLEAARFVPFDTSAPAGAESITYEQWGQIGEAKVVGNYTDDLPQADVFANQFTSAVASVASSYSWSIQDIRRSMMARSPFMPRKTEAARLTIDRKHDAAAFGGMPEVGTTGFANNAAVTVGTFPNAGDWASIDPDLILENLHYMARTIRNASLQIETPNTMVLAPTPYEIIASRFFDPVTGSARTILDVFLATSPYIKQVDTWPLLENAGASSRDRIVCYDRSDRVLQYNAPVLFESLPPQPRNLGFLVPCHGRAGVTEIHYPGAMLYADIIIP